MYNSSLDRTALNKSKEEDKNILARTLKQNSLVKNKNDGDERKTSTVAGVSTQVLDRKQSNFSQDILHEKSSLLIGELKK